MSKTKEAYEQFFYRLDNPVNSLKQRLEILNDYADTQSIKFAKWIVKNEWKFGGNGKLKHEGFYIQFKGRGAGFKKETADSLLAQFKSEHYKLK